MEPLRTAAPCLTRSLIAVSLVQGATEREGRGPNPSLRSTLRDRLPPSQMGRGDRFVATPEMHQGRRSSQRGSGDEEMALSPFD